MELVQLQKSENVFRKIAEWTASDRLKVTRSFEEILSQKAATIKNKVFKVVTTYTKPFLSEKINPDGTLADGNDQYEGFAKDLMDAIAKKREFQYVFDVVESHGAYDKEKVFK